MADLIRYIWIDLWDEIGDPGTKGEQIPEF